ncbi:hydroxyisourate hydrolase [Paenibacillus cremeus]|uniref:5-hydroxyisourate hydrolase n=1 Tax=Paenibacillus cremeus TaxID=2163881 RepID=A0A559K529_9BACL|nr:hydroxyisourate hydrolase [Paenibacillus cremeus]TVY07245.1 hydroxyisourate hydrolase [Paenibacillus cremeus]
MSGRLTTHVLDVSIGKPAGGMALELWRLDEGGAWVLVRQAVTNGDGRLDAPLLAGEECTAGVYELVFIVGEYFRKHDAKALEAQSQPPFLEHVPIRFVLHAPEEHYHVPLLVAPGGYSTYRGS